MINRAIFVGSILCAAILLFLGVTKLYTIEADASRLHDYTSHLGGKVPCDVPSRELVFARALEKACAQLHTGQEATCMMSLIKDVVRESDQACKSGK